MKIGDFNIRATPPMRKKRVRHDLALAESLGLWVYCWQELGKWKWYIRLLKVVFDPQRWIHLFEGRRNLITIRRGRYNVVHTISKVLTARAPWLPQPRRLANAALLEDRRSDSFEWVVNFHLTNGARNKRWFPKRIKEARQRRWMKEVEGLRDLMQELIEIANVPIWLCADSNSKSMPNIAPEGSLQVDVVKDAPMHVSVINPACHRRHSRIIGVDRLNTDHAGLVVEDRW